MSERVFVKRLADALVMRPSAPDKSHRNIGQDCYAGRAGNTDHDQDNCVDRAAEIGQAGVGRVENESDRTDGPKRDAQEFGPEKTFTDSCARQ